MKMWKSRKKLYESIAEYKKQHPEETLEEIGKVFNLTKQRISQILKYFNNGKGEKK